ncbi:MAG: NAD(+) diphosphatase [Gammaproteobacteria bacterium]|nr:NAD(+) diphosphatase [Gammaproteobacteria bacterium]
MTFFSYATLDRQAPLREQADQLQQRLHSPHSRILIWYQGKLIARETLAPFFSFDELMELKVYLGEPLFLGEQAQTSYFAYQLNQWHSAFAGIEPVGLRKYSAQIDDDLLSLLFYAQGLVNWHHNHPYCSNCGSLARISQAGHARLCENAECGATHYPKIDPAVIFSIVNNTGPESKILLGRKAMWDAHRYSVIAGFVEPGETLEDAVRREAYEETGLKLQRVDYVASQPWPFPDSLMLGFESETTEHEINLLDQELEAAAWFGADEIETKLQQGLFKMPTAISISWKLIDRWFSQQKGYSVKSLEP